MIITENNILSLREKIKPYLTDKRYSHTLAVERECERIGKLLLPDSVMKLRASALLHDITKAAGKEKQLQYCGEFGIIILDSDLNSPKLLHAKTAAALISRDFPEFSDAEIISGVRFHTTGRAGMTDFEAVVYLADYIEETRTFPDCVRLREFFWGGISSGEDPLVHFYRTMVKSFDMTITALMEDGSPIDRDTFEARNYFLCEKLPSFEKPHKA